MKAEILSIWKFCVACPSLAFISCLFLSLWTDWERSVNTQCVKDGKTHHPYNLLPSISMMISDRQPMEFIWRAAIGLHSFPRLFLGVYFRQKHLHLIGNKSRVNLMYFFYFLDILALIGLTYVQSNEWFIVHAISFGTFLSASPLFMITALSCVNVGHGAYRSRKRTFLLHLSSTFVTLFLYHHHNSTCNDFVYTFFALFEYIIVFSNIYFHFLFGSEFGTSTISIQSGPMYTPLPR
ncbi:Oidioi.mRNA.OKI2018_I69.chr1.g778.t1.cds [Oikopleura dioica]|uniref:Acyltransferase PGAP2 n=1 Tax=Oikopleura dioica TaxID=34765 RepID=A0ABN7SKW1_OIKDI|nr:Oidioi.mRNA.OKI2018_I69.chr1.g778.t1.cds [Oikopleura dioica]